MERRGWEANGQYVEYLSQLLHAACNVHDTTQQQQITKAMEDFNILPEADRYLLILLMQPTASETVRGMAGLILKNNLRQRRELVQETIFFMRDSGLVQLLGDGQSLVRRTVGTLISSIVRRLGRELGSLWPELIPSLLQLAATAEAQVASAAAETIAKICEDASDELLEDPTGPVAQMVPELIRLISTSASESVRTSSLLAINAFIFHDNVLSSHLATLIMTLSQRASAERGGRMRLAICQSLNMLLEAYPEELQPILPSIFDYMLTMLRPAPDAVEGEEAVALEACEFWLSVAERDSTLDLLSPRLSSLVPILMERIVYSDDDPDLELNNDHREQGSLTNNDIRPRHHDASYRGTLDSPSQTKIQQDDEEGEIDPDDSDGEEELQGHWTVRKCSAATIDVLATTMVEGQFLSILLPLVNAFITDPNWRRQEAGILALGAISEGCCDSMDEHLPQILPFLTERLCSSPVPLVRAIAAWTISRYARCLVDPTGGSSPAGRAALLALLQGMLDSNRRVQHSSCTALSMVAEKCPVLIMAHLATVCQCIGRALAVYERRNLIVLYDALGIVADTLHDSPKLCPPGATEMIGPLGPALLQKWHSTETADPCTLALLECLCSVTLATPSHLEPYARAIAGHALQIIQDVSTALSASSGHHDADVDYDVCIVALDLLGALSQGLREGLPPILGQTPLRLDQLLPQCLCDPIPAQIRQSAFALVGDLASCAPSALDSPPLLAAILGAIGSNLDVLHENSTQGSANNAVWAAGEIARRYPGALVSELPSLTARLGQFLQHYQEGVVSRGYMENVAVTLGRALTALPPPTNLAVVLARWCTLMSLVTNEEERETAWLPMISVLLANPALIAADCVPALLKSLATVRGPSAELALRIGKLVELIRSRLVGPDNWTAYRASSLSQVPLEFFATYCPAG